MLRNIERLATTRVHTAATLLGIAALAITLAGCGGDDGGTAPGEPATEECLLSVTLSGALSETLDYHPDADCSGTSTDLYTSLAWGGITAEAPIHVGLTLNASVGQPASDILSRVQVVSADGQLTWETPNTCLVDLTSSARGTQGSITTFDLEGQGSCSEAAIDPLHEGSEVQIGDFTFRARTLLP